MWLLRKIFGLLFLAAAALVGNWAGSQVRAQMNGTKPKPVGLVRTNVDGQTMIALNVTLTNFIPALLLGFVSGRPKSLFALVSGAVISILVGDAYEQAVSFDISRRPS